jgi:putative endonuclease
VILPGHRLFIFLGRHSCPGPNIAGAGFGRKPGFFKHGVSLKNFYVYILCSKQNWTLYIGVTSNLVKRIYEHKNNLADGFTKKYDVHLLVWHEVHQTAESAITREKQIKAWKRAWKLRLIEESNPEWNDLYESICK